MVSILFSVIQIQENEFCSEGFSIHLNHMDMDIIRFQYIKSTVGIF